MKHIRRANRLSDRSMPDPFERKGACAPNGRRLLSLLILVLAASILAAVSPGRSRAVGGNTVALGTVVDQNGAPASSVNVDVYADPGDAPLILLGSTTTAADGTWSLDVVPSQQLSDLASSNGGYVNFLATGSASSSGSGLWHFTRLLTAGGWVDPTDTSSGAGDPPLQDPHTFPLSGPQTPCSKFSPTYTIIATEDKYSDIGELHVARDTTATYTYGQTADSNFDVGVSIAGGSWQLSGSYHVGNGGGSSVSWSRPLSGQTSYGHRLQSQFHNIKRRISYVYHYYPPCPDDYDAFPKSWNSGALDGQDNSSNDYHCSTSPYWVNYGPATSFDRSTNKAYHFGGAVNLFGLISVGVDSGYSQFARSHWSFGSGQSSHYLCGNDEFPTKAHRIFAGWS